MMGSLVVHRHHLILLLLFEKLTNVTGAEIVVDGGATGAPQGAPAYRTE